MTHLKWFAGGKERGQQAITLVTELLTDLENNAETKPLQQILSSYLNELEENESPTASILSRLNIAASNIISSDKIPLSVSQSNLLKEISALSNIALL